MTTPMTGDKFADVLKRSGLVSDKILAEYAAQPSLASNATTFATALVRAGILTQFQAKLLLAGKYRGLILGQYKLLDQLGKGGMGTVYLAEHMSLKRKAAVKVLAYEQAGTTIGMERFYREAQSAAALDHPNIVKVYDVGQLGNVHYIAMEYVEGQTLSAMVEKNGPLHFATAADYIAQAAAGLQEAADKGFVHRDIKPDNLIVDKSGTLKILDMGLTRPTEDQGGERLTAVIDPESVVGTPDYIAPEQALNQPVDIRTDIYSLGVTFFALLAGRPPFTGTTAQKLLQHQLKEAPSLTSLRAKAPPEIGEIISIMMAKKPADRYQQPAEIIEALSPWLAADLVGANTKSVTGTLTRLTSRTRLQSRQNSGKPKWLIPAIIGGFLLIAGMGGVAALLLPGNKNDSAAKINDSAKDSVASNTNSSGQAQANTTSPTPTTTAPPAKQPVRLGPVPPGAWVVAPEGTDPAVPSYPTIAAALAAMKPTDSKRIVLRCENHAEQLTLEGAKYNGLTIESGLESGTVIWSLPSGGNPDKPLVTIRQVENVQLRGIRFEGQSKLQELIQIAGQCPGAEVEELTLAGFQRAGIALVGANGAEGKPISLKKVRCLGGPENAAGIVFTSGSAHRFVKLQENRFESSNGCGVLIAGAATDLELLRNRFWQLKAGIQYKPAGLPGALGLQIRQNTFANLVVGIDFAAPPQNPANAPNNALAIIDNLFIETGHLTRFADTPLMPSDPPVWIWYPEFTTSSNIPAQSRYFRREFTLAEKPTGTMLMNLGVDESFTLFVNGEEVGQSTHKYFSQRVYSFDITRFVQPGKNALAVVAKNELDPFNTTYATTAGLTAKLVHQDQGKDRLILVSDEQWKTQNTTPPEGWTDPNFNDDNWKPAKIWTLTTVNFPWRETVWDSVVASHCQGREKLVQPVVSGNIRDYFSMEGYPVLESRRTFLKVKDDYLVGMSPDDDKKFLRYSSSSPLSTAGTDRGPVGMPPNGQ